VRIRLADLVKDNRVTRTGGFTSESFIVHPLLGPGECEASFRFRDRRAARTEPDWYYVRVTEKNGHLAWVRDSLGGAGCATAVSAVLLPSVIALLSTADTAVAHGTFGFSGPVAVGPPVARRPPHRSRRAELPHRALASDQTHSRSAG
jgi:hypothetical protein